METNVNTQSLSRQVVRLLQQRDTHGGIPPVIRRKARQHIADALAIGLAATRSQPLAQQLLDAMSMGAGGGACGVFGSAARHAPSLAAFTNAALIHTLDFDDIHDAARLHPGRDPACGPGGCRSGGRAARPRRQRSGLGQ